MRIVQITPGSGDNFYCENCLRDNLLVRALGRLGHDAVMVPLYLPPRLKETGRDRGDPLFFGAPVVVFLHAHEKEKKFGKTDCVLAGSAMMYEAQSYGLGSCMIGFAEAAINMKRKLRESAGIPARHVLHLTFTLGYHTRPYRSLPIRKKMPVRYLAE